jgi:small subunit ribosomal protein S4e
MPHGIKKHLKRVNAPSAWNLDKMGGKWAPKPTSGPHKLRECLPLILILRNKLKYALDGKETMQICMQRNVLVDSKVRTDPTFPAGFMDVVALPKANEQFRVMYDEKGRFVLVKIDAEEAKFKLCKVASTSTGQRSVPLLTTHDGRTIRYPDPLIKVGDTVKLDVTTGKITDHLKLDSGKLCFVNKGRNTGRIGVLVSRERHLGSYDIAKLQDAAGTVFAVRLSAVFVIGDGKEKSRVTVPKGNGVKLSIIEEKEIKLKARAG